ncbi:bifunctional 5,10-methylenetetrahydrofolate dehydrogenase/5,10-methenyltetrahydrofolate cyclohydrolase [Paenibacillus nasutitermitis]|uniref:Bifunctional protein FolD n=1 Tax=Paenibacillus nasutitermitis TaxID=1652958 RepID=A0A917DXC1_9BACL|nr:bifunctional 5,10-methylenetetrahydrofolate dehydrogenase/5,10-methenyltetrahydrofolate cyclohydrolase [Paenibacillus nasutitermitis]GGD80501.1 bifunctional 5,10-methylene-tetrahydrofolate dehydrogenase/5,10-methylene-tetrahydrofolate cyclohydrolase [Paenibacillus nasutitermitis]
MARLLKAKPLADEAGERIKSAVNRWKKAGIAPAVAVLLAEGDPASAAYAAAKGRLAAKLGIGYELITFASDVTKNRLLKEIRRLNEDNGVHGILLELPLPAGLDSSRLAAALDPLKDIDGITPASKLACMMNETGLRPATPQSCIQLIKSAGVTLKGSHIVVVGRGETVGRPLMQMLLHENATVTVCHSHTKDLARMIQGADVLVTAAGKVNLIMPEMVHPGLVLIDAGINMLGDESGITGDAAPQTADYVDAMSPVPGGVGTLTTALLFENALHALTLQQAAGRLQV